MKKDLFIGICIAIPAAFLMIFIGGIGHLDFKFEKEDGKINMNPELSQCEILTNQMIQARNEIKQYALNPNQFSSEDAEKISNDYQNELNRITKEFSLKGCDKNLGEWMTSEITQRIIEQTGG